MATTYVSTIKSSAGDYTTLAACEAGRQAAHAGGDITAATGDDSIEEWVCFSLSDAGGRVDIDGWTTAAGNYLYAHADATGRHAGKWDATKYNFVVTDNVSLAIYEDYVRIDGLQLGSGTPTADNKHIFQTGTLTNGANAIWLSNLILKGHGNATYNQYGIYPGTNAIVYIWNTIIYGIPGHDADCQIIYGYNATLSIYSCTLIGGYNCVTGYQSVVVVKNTYAGGSASEDFLKSNLTSLAKTNCASEDQSADDTGTGETATNCVAAAVLIDTDTFVNVSAGTEDFHLAADGLSPLVGVGVDTSGEGTPLNFTTDIDGDTRS
jgi:hypothetical protein